VSYERQTEIAGSGAVYAIRIGAGHDPAAAGQSEGPPPAREGGTYSTISDAIRAAIDRFIDIQFSPDYIRKLMIELPKGNVVDLQQLVKSGDSVSVEDAVRNAVREYVRRRLHKAMEGVEK